MNTGTVIIILTFSPAKITMTTTITTSMSILSTALTNTSTSKLKTLQYTLLPKPYIFPILNKAPQRDSNKFLV